jgi:DNA-binding SARP family transcriptional activator/predicted ATPase
MMALYLVTVGLYQPTVRQSFTTMPSALAGHRIRLFLLGGFQARLDGMPVAGIAYTKMRALLAYLAVEREQDHQREFLASLLWPVNEASTARGNLRRTLADLRRVLELPTGLALFSVSRETIRFDPNMAIDVADFADTAQSDLAQVAALYQGEFLAGLNLPDCPDFEEWLLARREALHSRALGLMEKLADQYEQAGASSKALPFSLRLAELAPLDEGACRRAMRLYVANGQSSAAIGHFDACRRLLKQDLGVLPTAETRHLAESIKDLEPKRHLPDQVTARPLQNTLLPLAERRQVTVMYCELSAAQIDDPEEAMALLSAPQARCSAIITRFSGHIVQVYGGGLLAYFGYPKAHEEAARRAVQAALEVTRETSPGVDVRAGIHTGLVITGGASEMPDTSGSVSRVAIQLRRSIGPGEVAISQATQHIAGGYFDAQSLGAQPVDGLSLPLEIYRVMQENQARTRLDASARLTPLAGRKVEITQLMDLWQAASNGERHVVLLQGDAGIGKSRLLHAMKSHLAATPQAVHEMRCSLEDRLSPFRPLIAMLEDMLGFEQDDLAQTRLDKLRQYLQAHYPTKLGQALPRLTELLSLPLADEGSSLELPVAKRKEQTIAILLELLQSLSQQQPTLLILEDVHWIDPSSLELLSRFVAAKGASKVLAVITARPDFVSPWPSETITSLALKPLTEAEVKDMALSLHSAIPESTLERIVKRADGVPLFVEEITRVASLNHDADIPATLHELLSTRLDQMGPAKYTAQLAASVGRIFDLGLLCHVFPHGEELLAQTLQTLTEAGLLLNINKNSCKFKHALIHEAAYQSQTKAQRQMLHQHIAQVIERDFSERADVQPELLARHLSCSGDARRAIDLWIKAGHHAIKRSANAEAVGALNSGLDILVAIEPGPERDRLEFELCVSKGAALMASRGYGHTETELVYTRAVALAEQLGDPAGLFRAHWGLWLSSSSSAGNFHSIGIAQKLLQGAEQQGDPLQLQQALYAMGHSLVWSGQIDLARSHLERAITLYAPSHHGLMAINFGKNTCVANGALLACGLWLQGYADQALQASQSAVTLARQVKHPHTLVFALCFAAIIHRLTKKIEATGQLAREAQELASINGLSFWQLMAVSTQGWVMVNLDQPEGFAKLQKCLAVVKEIMSGAKIMFLTPLSEALVHAGKFEQALPVVAEALDAVNANNDRYFESEYHRLKGLALLGFGQTYAQDAEACFTQALAISRAQGAKSLELRATMSLSRLWATQGKPAQARQMLGEIFAWFTEGFETADLQEAAALMVTWGTCRIHEPR